VPGQYDSSHSDCAILSLEGRYYCVDVRDAVQSRELKDVTNLIAGGDYSTYFEIRNNLLTVYSHAQLPVSESPISASDRENFAHHVIYETEPMTGTFRERWRDNYTSKWVQAHDRLNRSLMATVDWEEGVDAKRKYILDFCLRGECVCSIVLRDMIPSNDSIGLRANVPSPLLYFENGVVILSFPTRLGLGLTLLRFDRQIDVI
jgi:hypothetical protein